MKKQVSNPQPRNQKPMSYSALKRLQGSKQHEFQLISDFKYGYRNREDKTNLPVGVLVEGSKNVLTNVSDRIQVRKGYLLDGPASTNAYPIVSADTFVSNLRYERNLRSYLPTSSTGVLEYRYIDPTTGAITWRTLLSSLTSASFNFAHWWDTSELLRKVLMVNGTNNVYEWAGGVTVALSATGSPNTITKVGTTTWAQDGFTTTGTRGVVINGTTYTYTGGETTTILTGVSADASADIAADPVVHQAPITTTLGSMTDIALSRADVIGVFARQLYIGSFYDQTVYISKSNDYKTYTTSDINESGFGQKLSLDSAPVSINALENAVVISAGKNQWYEITYSNSTYTDGTNPSAPVVYNVTDYIVNRLKTTANQAAQSQAMVSALKNDLVFISNEPTMDTLGRVEQILGAVQTSNISDSIKLDFDSYDFTGAAVFYNKYFIYLSIPTLGIVRIYNIKKGYWEAPQTIPVSMFYTVDGILYGHSSLTTESYKLFDGTADRVDPTTNPLGSPIPAVAAFSYQNYGTRNILKNFNEYYIEGYISSNATLTAGINYDLDGCNTYVSYPIVGSNKNIVCIPGSKASLGKESLGKNPLGGDLITQNANLPPKFRVIKTFPSVDFFENQFVFSSNEKNTSWEILSFGPNLRTSPSIANNIRD